jgi:hypothetical protein
LTPEGGNCRACCFKHQTAFTELSNQKLKNSKTQKLRNAKTRQHHGEMARFVANINPKLQFSSHPETSLTEKSEPQPTV